MRSIQGRLKSSETLSSVWPDERSFEGTMFRFRFGNSALLETWKIIEIARNVLRVSRVFWIFWWNFFDEMVQIKEDVGCTVIYFHANLMAIIFLQTYVNKRRRNIEISFTICIFSLRLKPELKLKILKSERKSYSSF